MGTNISLQLRRTIILVTCLSFISGCDFFVPSGEVKPSIKKVDHRRPNVLLIVADDLGYSDMGAYGGEINTPNLDQLAQSGVQLTNFYAAPNCSPTRSMLLSGTDNHIAGLGTMAEAKTEQYQDVPGYEGYLNSNIAALPELMRDAGYHTYMSGKWHLGKTPEQSPTARGFEQSFSLLQGGASHFNNVGIGMGEERALYRQNGKLVKELPADFYSTRTYTERMIDYIGSHYSDGKPFFGYLAYTAPHWPLMAPEAAIKKYEGRYSDGYFALQQQRIARMKALGMIGENENIKVQLPRNWMTLSEKEKAQEARAMEIYAAMVDDMDSYIGQLLAYLKSIDALDNTLIIFMSDNGAEGHDFSHFPPIANWVKACCDNSLENMGKVNSYVWYGPGWGTVSSTPFGGYKGFPLQGGIRVPALIVHPEISGGRVNREPLSVMDIMPTILEVAGATHPAPDYKGRKVAEMRGKSMWPMLKGESQQVHPDNYVIALELFGKRAVQRDEWTMVSLGAPWDDGKWKLYNLLQDISQTRDVSEENPKILAEMMMHWEAYQRDVNVVMPITQSPY